MASITIQQAYAISLGVWQNPYNGGLLDGGTLLGGGLDVSPNYCFKDDPSFLNTFLPTTKNRLQRLLDGTTISLPGLPGISGVGTFGLGGQVYTLEGRTATVANSTAQGFETPIFEPKEFIGATRQNYNYRTGSDLNNASNIQANEQLYHLAGIGLLKKIKK